MKNNKSQQVSDHDKTLTKKMQALLSEYYGKSLSAMIKRGLALKTLQAKKFN